MQWNIENTCKIEINPHFFFVSGNIATIRSYVASATFMSERTSQMAMIQSYQALGFLIGPGIQAALTPLGCAEPRGEDEAYVSFDMFTATG